MITTRIARAIGGVTAILVSCGLSCGGDSLPVCPTGNCTLPGEVIVKWQFDAYPALQFSMDSCVDFGVNNVQVDAVDGLGAVTTMSVGCGAAQATFETLAAGDYTVYVTPLDADGNPLVTSPVAGTVTAGAAGSEVDTTINVPYTAWVGVYTGTFLFRLSWNGMSCAMAMPAVATQVLTLMSGGVAVAQVTDTGQRLDGTDPEPCRELTEGFPQTVTQVPFGPATFVVIGKDSSDVVQFQHSFDTFVGAGISNPTITYNVPPPPGLDAGIDSM